MRCPTWPPCDPRLNPLWMDDGRARMGPAVAHSPFPRNATMAQPLDDVMDELRATVRGELRMGFTPANEIVGWALGDLGEDERGRMRPALEHLLRVEADALLREQARWPEVTDCDRLDRAFRALEKRGIVARQHFSCCQTCGSREIWGEMEDVEHLGLPVRGYTFYHVQDTGEAVAGHGLYLCYGSVEEDEDATVGDEVVAALREHGLQVEWDGTSEKRIRVLLDWKRRRADL
jgi:hypothetical protein